MGRLSITQKLRKVRTKGKAVQVLTDWRESWERQFRDLIREMDRAKQRGDLRALGACIFQLNGMQEKLFTGIRAITQQLIQPDGPLDPEDPTPLWTDEE